MVCWGVGGCVCVERLCVCVCAWFGVWRIQIYNPSDPTRGHPQKPTHTLPYLDAASGAAARRRAIPIPTTPRLIASGVGALPRELHEPHGQQRQGAEDGEHGASDAERLCLFFWGGGG